MKKQIALIGLGKQNTKDHLLAAQRNENVNIVAVCDQNAEVAIEWGDKLGVPAFNTVDEMLNQMSIDAAIVAVPHFAYKPIIIALAAHGVSILKEKPLAMDYAEALEIADIVKNANINLTVAVQRKHNKIYKTFLEYVSSIGDVFSIHGHYTLNIAQLDGDWRRSRELAGGGAVLDMGYHLIDLIVWYFDMPERISAELGYHNRKGQDYDVEDTAKVQFSYMQGGRRILGSLLLSRIYPEKEETLSVYGTNGSIVIYKDHIELRSLTKELRESVYMQSNGEDMAAQLDTFVNSLNEANSEGNYKDHLKNMAFIDAIYRSDDKGMTVAPFTDHPYAELDTIKPVTKVEL